MAYFPPEQRADAAVRTCVMARSGILRREGSGRCDYTYALGREPRTRRAEAYKTEPKPAKPRRKAAPKPAPAPRRVLVRESLPSAAPKQPQPRPQTVAEFLAAGWRIQQLPPFAVSKPLRRIGMEAARVQ